MRWVFAAVDSFVITDGRRDLLRTTRLIGGPESQCELQRRQGRVRSMFAAMAGWARGEILCAPWTLRLWHPCWRPNCARLFGRPIESAAPCATEQ